MSRQVVKQFSTQLGVIKDPTLGITFDWKSGAPSNSTDVGYAPGAIMLDVTNAFQYINTGSKTSSTWVKQVYAGGTFTTLTVTTLTAPTLITGSVGNGGSTVAFTDRITTTDGVSSGTARIVGGLAYSNVAAATTVGGTSAETVFDANYTIPANTLKAGSVMKVRYAGFGVTGSGTDTFAHKLYIGGSGGTAILSSAALQLATSSTFTGEVILQCRTAGTTGTFVSFGTYKQSSAEGTMTVKDDYTASTTLNTTANQAVVVTGTWNNANTTSARLDTIVVEIW